MEATQELHVRLKTLNEIAREFERWFRAREDATENPLTTKETEFATRLADLKRETLARIKTIKADITREADEFRAKL